jgi:hypothetical protein
VVSDPLDADRVDPVDRSPEPDRFGDLRRSGLELPRQVGPRGFVRGDGADHVPATDERRHLLEQRAPAVEDADPGRTVGLVPRPGVEVGIDRAQVDRQLRHRLGAVDQHHRTGLVSALGDRRHGVDRPEHVRYVDERHQLRPARQQRVEGVEIQLAVAAHWHVGELRFAVLTQDLPRHDVRVMLHLGQHDEVAAADVLPTPCVRDEVDRGGCVGGEERLLRCRAKPLRDPAPRAFIEVGRLDREWIDAPVDRRARLGVVPGHRVDHRLRRLGGRSRVEVGQRVPVERPPQDWELGRQLAEVER